MRIFHDYRNCPPDARGSVIALGNFDGVHRGHQAVIGAAQDLSRKCAVPAAVMTFEPHPVSLFKPDIPPFRLTNGESKAQLIAGLGVDALFVMPFDRAFSQISAEDFIRVILVESLAVSHVVIGYDFIFGHNRGGNAAMLEHQALQYGFGFTQAEGVGAAGQIFSSTRIREQLRQGNLEKAAEMLGRDYVVTGKVVHGDKRGRSIGFPTLNIDSGDALWPASGVYAVTVTLKDQNYKAVTNIGTKPTFNGSDHTLEVHVFDFDKEVYGAEVAITFIERLRSESKFSGIEELKAQIQKDCNQARKRLGSKT